MVKGAAKKIDLCIRARWVAWVGWVYCCLQQARGRWVASKGPETGDGFGGISALSLCGVKTRRERRERRGALVLNALLAGGDDANPTRQNGVFGLGVVLFVCPVCFWCRDNQWR